MNKRNARDVSLEVLVRVESENSYSNIELNNVLRRSNLSQVDRGLVTELVYGTLQRRNTLDWMLAPFVPKGLDKLDVWVRELLRMSVYQFNYLGKIPDHAAVHEAVEIAKRRGHRGVSSFVNAVLRNVLRNPDRQPVSEQGLIKRLSLAHSHPEWLVERWLKEWDEETVAAICEANSEPPSHTIRVNRLKTSRERLKERLEAEKPDANIRMSDFTAQGLVVDGFGNIGNSKWYRDGLCSIQDESSMLVAEVLQPSPGSRVLDMSAAPGGKATHLAELMDGRGSVEAYDIHEHKVNLIAKHAKRLGLHNVTARQADARQLPHLVSERFDYVLLDAPCSGFGVIRRKPEIKWRKSKRDIGSLVELQQQLLDAAAQLVKPGGVLVYSTCTLERRENEQQIERFLNHYPAYKPDEKTLAQSLPHQVVSKCQLTPGMLRILPQHFNSDGFFIARLMRKE